jgi:hypothetical protein
MKEEIENLKRELRAASGNAKSTEEVVFTSELPALNVENEASIRKYEARARAMLSRGLGSRIRRNTCSQEMSAMINLVWNLSEERRQMGPWQDSSKVDEEYFLEFLKNAFIKNKMLAESTDTVFSNFASSLAKNKIKFTLDNRVDLIRKIANLTTAWNNLPQVEITEEWEKAQVETILRQLLLKASKSATDSFRMDMLGSKPKPTKFQEITDMIVKYHNLVMDWN